MRAGHGPLAEAAGRWPGVRLPRAAPGSSGSEVGGREARRGGEGRGGAWGMQGLFQESCCAGEPREREGGGGDGGAKGFLVGSCDRIFVDGESGPWQERRGNYCSQASG